MGGADQVQASNINKTYDEKKYFATYFQDDWKVSPKLTLNLGLRYDYFGPINETNGGQANLLPAGLRTVLRPILFRQPARTIRTLSAELYRLCWRRTESRLDQTDKYGQGLVQDAKDQFCATRWLRLSSSTRRLSCAAALECSTTHLRTRDMGRISAKIIPLSTTSTINKRTSVLRSVTPISAGSP